MTSHIRTGHIAGSTNDGARTIRGNGLATVRVAGREFPREYGRKCRVCNSPWRDQIEEQLLYSRGYKLIISLLPAEAREGDNPITAASIKNHVNSGHLPINAAMSHVIALERAEFIGKNIEEMAGSVLDYVVLGRSMMDKYYQSLMQGETVPSGSEILGVMRMFAQIDAMTDGSVETDVYNEVFAITLDTVRALVSPEQYDEVVFRVAQHPVVKALIEKQARRNEAAAALGSG